MPIEKPRERSTIGLVVTDTVEVWEQLPWQGVEDVVREHDANLLIFAGGALKGQWRFAAHANVIYDLIVPECVDGFVIGTGAFDSYTDPETTREFCELHRPLPVVTVEHAISDFPGALLDDYQSMRQVLAHLIEVHGCRHIAYMGSPATAHAGFQARYRAYVETLQAYGLSFDPNLVYSGGDEAGLINWLKEQVSGIDALAGQESLYILSGLRVLQSLGVRVPGDVVVAGFNDTAYVRAATPPLTTLRPPYYEMGQRAAEILLALLAGEPVVERETLVGRLIVRQSCGCIDPTVVQAAAGSVERTGKDLAAMAGCREEILVEMAQAIEGLAVGVDSEWSGRLLDAFVAALVDESSEGGDGFLQELGDLMRQAMVAESRPLWGVERGLKAWHGAISALQRSVLPYLDGAALLRYEGLGQRARVVIAEAERRMQGYLALQAEQRAEMLRDVGASLLVTFDVDELMDVLAEQLPSLGIPSCYLSLYEDPRPYCYPEPAPEWSRLVLAYSAADSARSGGRIELERGGLCFRSRELLAEGMWPRGRRFSFMVEPLHFQEHQLGFVLFELGPRDGAIYSTLRAQISSALYGALLLRERERVRAVLERVYTAVEKQVEERTAQLQREMAERERAQEENLRLQQEVIEAQQRAIQELSTPVIPVLEGVIVVPLIGSVDSLRARDITRRLLAGVQEHRARVVILDITGVPIVDSGVAVYLNKTIQAVRLKGARTIVTGISNAVAETIVDLGIDWSGIETLGDLQSGLRAVLGTQLDLRASPAC
jgi:DNA-binding LacI/PurR family transcriptional regulator/anti-anti-sigma regulatory factor